jgi:hypothetical protein
MVKLNFKRITNGKNVWHVDGTVSRGVASITRIYGNINDEAGIRDALAAMMDRPRYYR